jgi:regulator of protease activity HflC (stomatin/prohibitin superfamily)
MDAALGWIGWIAEWVGNLIPRWLIVPATHGGVKFVRGAEVRPFGPGVVWYWPAITQTIVYPTARQTVDLRTQTLVTTDGKVVGVGGMVSYRVVDIEALIGKTYDCDQTIKDICAGAISEVVRSASWPDLQSEEFGRELRTIMRRRLRPFGVKVLRTTLTDCAPCRVLKIVNAQSADVG